MGQRKKKRPITKAEVVSEWTTGKVSEFRDGDAVMRVAHQMDQRGMHRIALVNEAHEVVTAGYGAVYQHPCFATFGMHQFMGLSDYYKGDVLTETVYLISLGRHSSPLHAKRGKLAAVWEGWYIESVAADKYGSDLIELVVNVRHSSGETHQIEETLNPDIGDIEDIRVEEYGGEGKDQQSLVLIVASEDVEDDEDGNRSQVEVNAQVEIDHTTGFFKNLDSLEWERI